MIKLTDFTVEELTQALEAKKASAKQDEETQKKAKEVRRRDATKQISDKLEAVKALLKECEGLAEDAAITFNFSPAYGMGGTYNPVSLKEEYKLVGDEYYEVGWVSSSANC